MTNEQVDMVEGLLREARKKIEEACRMVCGELGDAAVVWYDLTVKAEGIEDSIRGLYRLRS